MKVVRYTKEHKSIWDKFVTASKNATFLFYRDYMDYHSSRFTDASLLIYEGDTLTALLPANIDSDKNALVSHAGLTYGGILLSSDTRANQVLEAFSRIAKFAKEELKVSHIVYKPIPYIYSMHPAQEDLYALFAVGATPVARAISTTIDCNARIPMSTLRKRKATQAKRCGVTCGKSNDFATYWQLLTDTLQSRHAVMPVHTLDEIELLHSRFPHEIQLFTATLNGETVAGVVLYISNGVVHLQYIAASESGRQTGALDALIVHIIEQFSPGNRYIDFGISTEDGGRILNEGLIFQKEGFGGRAVVYDAYRWTVK